MLYRTFLKSGLQSHLSPTQEGVRGKEAAGATLIPAHINKELVVKEDHKT